MKEGGSKELPKKDTGTTSVDAPAAYINRELSWLSFAERVLALAEDRDVPLLERVKFAGIMGMIYDEFTMKRIGGLRRRVDQGDEKLSPDGRTSSQELNECRAELQRQTSKLCRLIQQEIRPALAAAGIPILDYTELSDEQRAGVVHYFRESVEPILTPLAVDAGHPFPFISNLGLNLAIVLSDKKKKRKNFVRIKVPPNRPRWVPVAGGGFVPLEQVIAANLELIFPAAVHRECYFFRLARGAKDDPWDRTQSSNGDSLAPGSLIGMVSAELTARKFAGVVRLQVDANMPDDLQKWLSKQLKVDKADIEPMTGLIGILDLLKFQPQGFPELRDKQHQPVTHPRLLNINPNDPSSIFHEIRRGDILLHHPYHDFDTSVLQFLQSAARDPEVLAIKLTVYRTSNQSPIIQALSEAAIRGKQVAVLVEITARFDEAPNIAWGETLEKAGAHVVYGMMRLKTHVKLALVVREEEDGIRRYVHVATGNYNVRTARLYEDLGMLSCDPKLGTSVSAVFNELTGAIPAQNYDPLLVAPHNLRRRFTELIQREAEHARAGRRSGIHAKMNQLQDPNIIRELYLASQAGVPMTFNIRGLCCLRAGVPGLSESIRVYSTLGQFLEHGRIYRFENDGEPEFFIGSADWMKRNLDRRMETVVQITDPVIKEELEEILRIYETDNCSAWDMMPDGSYVKRAPKTGEEKRAAQETFIAITESKNAAALADRKGIKQASSKE